MERFPRVKNKGYFLLFSVMALIMALLPGDDLFHFSWGNTPEFMKVFIVTFLCLWYGFLVFLFLFGLTGFQSVELSQDEIRICMGPLVLRRIPTVRIKTVGQGVVYGKRSRSPQLFLLILSSKTTETLNEKGMKRLKNKDICSRMRQCGVYPEGTYAGARAYLFEQFAGFTLWIEDSDKVCTALRKYLTTTVFIL